MENSNIRKTDCLTHGNLIENNLFTPEQVSISEEPFLKFINKTLFNSELKINNSGGNFEGRKTFYLEKNLIKMLDL